MMDITNAAAIVVDEKSLETGTACDVVQSNVDFVNWLLAEYYHPDELSQDAMRSYCVDCFHGEMLNGGFGQFVYNYCWREESVKPAREGMAAMGAAAHLQLFEEGAALVASLGDEGLTNLCAATLQHYGESPELSALNVIDRRFFELDRRESLRELNKAWLKRHPNLAPASTENIRFEIRRRAKLTPDRAERIALAEADAPRFSKLIRALVEKAGQTYEGLVASDPNRYFAGEKVMAWHFQTNHGLFHMIDAGGKAIMFRGRSTTDRVCEIDAP